MNFEVPSYIVLMIVVGFASTQAVLLWQMKRMSSDLQRVMDDMGIVKSKLFNGMTTSIKAHEARLDKHDISLEHGNIRFNQMEIACARNHAPSKS